MMNRAPARCGGWGEKPGEGSPGPLCLDLLAGVWALSWPLTSAGVILHQELVQSSPASPNSHHQGASQDPDHAQLLGLPKLERQWERVVCRRPFLGSPCGEKPPSQAHHPQGGDTALRYDCPIRGPQGQSWHAKQAPGKAQATLQ